MSSGQSVIRLGFGRAVGERILGLEMSMTQKKALKHLVRTRAAKTGESYSAARRHLRSNQENAMNSVTQETYTCTICAIASENASDRSFVVSDAIAICSSCAQRAGTLAERATDGEVVRMMPPRMHQDMKAAMAWARGSGSSGPGYELVESWKAAEGTTPITPEQINQLISLWSSAGSPQPGEK